jgi:F0F1-type ATP synthase assembly protein I
MATSSPRPMHDDDEPTIGKLVAETTRDFSTLIRSEIELAKTEIKVSLKFGGVGAALLAAAAFVGILAIIIVSIAFALFLDWWFAGTATAFLIVFVIYLLVAGLLALLGIRNVKRVRAPEQTIAAVKSNKQILKRG